MRRYLCVERDTDGFHVYVHHSRPKHTDGFKEISLQQMDRECFHPSEEKVYLDVMQLMQDLHIQDMLKREPVKPGEKVTRPDIPSLRPKATNG